LLLVYCLYRKLLRKKKDNLRVSISVPALPTDPGVQSFFSLYQAFWQLVVLSLLMPGSGSRKSRPFTANSCLMLQCLPISHGSHGFCPFDDSLRLEILKEMCKPGIFPWPVYFPVCGWTEGHALAWTGHAVAWANPRESEPRL
jgi:hypothetical protein